MSDPKHPIWSLAGLLMYNNGADHLKDGGLIAIVGGLSAAVAKFTGGSSS